MNWNTRRVQAMDVTRRKNAMEPWHGREQRTKAKREREKERDRKRERVDEQNEKIK